MVRYMLYSSAKFEFALGLLQCEKRNAIISGKMKTWMDLQVAAEYGLKQGTAAALVARLLKDLAYIYPGDILTVSQNDVLM